MKRKAGIIKTKKAGGVPLDPPVVFLNLCFLGR